MCGAGGNPANPPLKILSEFYRNDWPGRNLRDEVDASRNLTRLVRPAVTLSNTVNSNIQEISPNFLLRDIDLSGENGQQLDGREISPRWSK